MLDGSPKFVCVKSELLTLSSYKASYMGQNIHSRRGTSVWVSLKVLVEEAMLDRLSAHFGITSLWI